MSRCLFSFFFSSIYIKKRHVSYMHTSLKRRTNLEEIRSKKITVCSAIKIKYRDHFYIKKRSTQTKFTHLIRNNAYYVNVLLMREHILDLRTSHERKYIRSAYFFLGGERYASWSNSWLTCHNNWASRISWD